MIKARGCLLQPLTFLLLRYLCLDQENLSMDKWKRKKMKKYCVLQTFCDVALLLLEWWFITITELYKRDLLEEDKKRWAKKRIRKQKRRHVESQMREEEGTKNLQGSLPKREALQQRHLVPSIKNNFYESQREFPHNTQLSSHYSALKRQLSNNIC